MHILITRPAADAVEWTRRLEDLGVAVTVDPLLSIDFEAAPRLDLDGAVAVIATSRNALRAIETSPDLGRALPLPVYAVGPATAELANAMGFATVHTGPASARELVPMIAAGVAPGRGHVLHFSGDKLAFDLAAALGPSGIEVRRRIVYTSRPATELRPATRERLGSGAIDTVALLSPLSARTFIALARQGRLIDPCRRLAYVCLSQNVAAEVAELSPAKAHVAQAPNSDVMLLLIEQIVASQA